MSEAHPPRTYVFEPRDNSVLLGLGVVQCGLLGVGLVGFVLALTIGVPPLVAGMPMLTTTAGAFARVGGRPAWQWLPLAGSWLLVRVNGRRRWCAPLALVTTSAASPVPLPPCLAGLELVELAATGGWPRPLGAVLDRAAGTLTALVRVEGAGFALATRSEQEQQLGAWGDLLAELANERGPITQVAWSDFASPSGLAEHRTWLEGLPASQPTGIGDGPVESYRELLEGACSVATTHEVIVSLTADRSRLPRRGVGDKDLLLGEALRGAVDGLARGLRAAGLQVVEPLAPTALQRLLRLRIDPSLTRPRVVAGRLAERLGEVTAAGAVPVAVECGWSHVRLDGAWHRTYWVEEWPQRPQPPSWLEPFLSGGGVTRTVTVILQPVAGYASDRHISRELVRLDSDTEARQEKGRRITARHLRARAAVEEREAELVAGYVEMAYLGLVTVSAVSEQELLDGCDVIEHLARRHGLGLRSLDARQDLAWAAALPFGLAPKSLIGT